MAKIEVGVSTTSRWGPFTPLYRIITLPLKKRIMEKRFTSGGGGGNNHEVRTLFNSILPQKWCQVCPPPSQVGQGGMLTQTFVRDKKTMGLMVLPTI